METVNESDLQEQRKRAVKTAWVLAAIAILIFLAFVFSGVRGA